MQGRGCRFDPDRVHCFLLASNVSDSDSKSLPWSRRLIGLLRDARVSLPLTAALVGLNFSPTVADPPEVKPAEGKTELVVVHVPGISGIQRKDRTFLDSLCNALEAGGEVTVVERRNYEWRRGRSTIDTLQQIEANRKLAAELAGQLRELKTDHPDAKLLVTSHSGGAGVAAWAIEQLEPGQGGEPPVDGLLFMAAATSPGFDLSAALSNVSASVSLVSRLDTILLVAGTTSFGTIDGVKTAAAGQAGFALPESADREQYAKLREVDYDPAWEEHQWFGDHEGMLRAGNTTSVVAPIVRRMLGLENAGETDETAPFRPIQAMRDDPATRPVSEMTPAGSERSGG